MLLDIEAIRKGVLSIIYEYLGATGLKFAGFLGNLMAAFFILILGMKLISYIVKLCRHLFEQSKMDPTLQSFLVSFLKIGLKIFVIFLAITKIGVAASSVVAIVGSAGLALGLSLQGSLSNIAGGVLLLLIKPFQVGDYIIEESSGKEGTVQAIGIMYTKLLSLDNKAVMIPNGNLSNSSITNVTYQEKRRVDINIGIEYSEDIKKVRNVLETIIEKEPAWLSEEPLQIFVSEFKDSSIDMGLRYWVKTEDYWPSRWRTLENIKEEFDRHGISIPFNQLDVKIVREN